jgi:very-short-patch-repair endonuclease
MAGDPAKKRIRGAPKTATEAARALRREMTPAERVLWERVRANRLAGLPIRRQHPIGPFILDFACASLRLGIEVDGSVHDETWEQDQARDDILQQHGWTMLRFTNAEVMHQLDDVLARIRAAAEGLEPRHWPKR